MNWVVPKITGVDVTLLGDFAPSLRNHMCNPILGGHLGNKKHGKQRRDLKGAYRA